MMRAMRSTLLLMLCACNSGTTTMMMTQRPPLGDPITTTMNTWTWVDFPDTSCDDGTPTGIGVNQGSSSNLIVFMNGGGACWDYLTCFMLNTATHGPYGKAQFDAQQGNLAGTLFDRNDATNPFKDWSFVFVPYCTGDVHAGDNVVMYSDNQGMNTHTYHHTGHKNILSYVPRIAGTWPSPGKLVVSGSSAGGYGASFNYDTFRKYWPAGKVYLLDDSGPTLEGDAIPPGYRSAWYMEWNLGEVLDPICGAACMSDFSQAIKILADRYKNDRMALLSSLQDQTIRNYFLLSPTGFQGELTMMAHDILDPTTNFKYFFVDGQTHTMLGNVGNFMSQGTPLQTWLTQLVNDDPAWTTLQP
jgi:hypothetical protein